jgi:radical SAM protein with 4Fe4S-binding SPASM domain
MDKVYSISPKEGETRLCLDPWGKVFIRVNGDVHLCCYNTKVGNLQDGPLDEVLNNKKAKSYREGLLTGKLQPQCGQCGDKKVCSIDELKSLVEEYYQTGRYFE